MNQDNDDNVLFSSDKGNTTPEKKESWKILIVDDEEDIHDVTKFVLKNFEFERKDLLFYSAYTLEEAKKLIKEHPDTALILLDIVMEEEDSGLKFVKYLREDLKNNTVRVILRTGQPGVAPQNKVVIDYDINDYKEKTELTREKFFSAVIIALRSFSVLKALRISLDEFQSSFKSVERFLPQNYVRILNKKSISEIKLGDFSVQDMTVLFIDISTLITSKNNLTPQENLNLINSFMKYLDPVLIEQKGLIETFIGDAIMALFYGSPDHAIKASIEIIKNLNTFDSDPVKNHFSGIRIGIYSGLLTLGTVGSEERMDYTAFGDTVHLAAQLQNLNRHYHSSILIGKEALDKISQPETFHRRWIANFLSREEKEKTIPVYEIFDADEESVIQLKQETKALFESAVQDYVENRHEEARNKFKQVLEINPKDEIAKVYLQIIT